MVLATAPERCPKSRASKAVRPRLVSSLSTWAIASASGALARVTRSRSAAPTSFSSTGHSPSRAASLARAASSPAGRSPRKQRHRLRAGHGVDPRLARPVRQGAAVAGGDEPCAVRAAAQERTRVRGLPEIVDDDEDASVGQQLGQPARRRLLGGEARPLAREREDEVLDAPEQRPGRLAQGHPEGAVEKGVLDVGVGAERSGERRLAVAAGAPEGRGDGDGLALGVEQRALEGVELRRARHEVRGRRLGHHRHARQRRRRPLELAHEPVAALGHAERHDVRPPHPAGEPP